MNTIVGAIYHKGQQMYQRYWDEFVLFAAHLVEGKATFLPASPYLVRCFCQALSTQGRAPSTIRGYLTSIAGVHKAAGFPDPTAHYLTRRLIKGLVLAHGSVDDRDPLSEQDLTSLLHALRHVGRSSYNLSLFRAMFVLMFFGFLRISEVTKHRHNLQYNQCTVTSACVKLTFHSYKHSHVKPYRLEVPAMISRSCPRKLLTRYLQLRGSAPGPLFHYADKKPVSRGYFAKVLKSAVTHAHLPGRITPHSFRIGAAVQLLRGIPLNRLQFLDAGGLTHTCHTFGWLIANLHGDPHSLVPARLFVCLFVAAETRHLIQRLGFTGSPA